MGPCLFLGCFLAPISRGRYSRNTHHNVHGISSCKLNTSFNLARHPHGCRVQKLLWYLKEKDRKLNQPVGRLFFSIAILGYPGAYYMFLKVLGCEVTSICGVLPGWSYHQCSRLANTIRPDKSQHLSWRVGIWHLANTKLWKGSVLWFKKTKCIMILWSTQFLAVHGVFALRYIRDSPPKKVEMRKRVTIQGWRHGFSDPESSMRRPEISGEYAGLGGIILGSRVLIKN